MAKPAIWVANYQCDFDKSGRKPQIRGTFTVAETKRAAEEVMRAFLLAAPDVCTVELLEGPAKVLLSPSAGVSPGDMALKLKRQGLIFVVRNDRLDDKTVATIVDMLIR